MTGFFAISSIVFGNHVFSLHYRWMQKSVFSERKIVWKKPIRGFFHVQFPPAGGTVCAADRSPARRKDTQLRVFSSCVNWTLWINGIGHYFIPTPSSAFRFSSLSSFTNAIILYWMLARNKSKVFPTMLLSSYIVLSEYAKYGNSSTPATISFANSEFINAKFCGIHSIWLAPIRKTHCQRGM